MRLVSSASRSCFIGQTRKVRLDPHPSLAACLVLGSLDSSPAPLVLGPLLHPWTLRGTCVVGPAPHTVHWRLLCAGSLLSAVGTRQSSGREHVFCEQTGAWCVGWSVLWRAAGGGGEGGACGGPMASAAPHPAAPLPSLALGSLAPTSPIWPHPPAPSSRVQCLRPFPRLVHVVWPSCVQKGEALPRASAHREFIHGTGELCVLGALWAGGSRGWTWEAPGRTGAVGAWVAVCALQAAGGAWEQRRGSATPQGWEQGVWPLGILVVQSLSRVRRCDPTDCSTPSLPVHHQLLELTQTHVHWVSDAIQPSHPLSSPSPPALNLSQHQGLFQWVSSSHQVAKVLELQLQHQSFQWVFRVDFL